MLEFRPNTSRLDNLMAALRSYLPQSEYNKLARKIIHWEPETILVKMKHEIDENFQIPKDPNDERCVKIYSYLYNLDDVTTKSKLLSIHH